MKYNALRIVLVLALLFIIISPAAFSEISSDDYLDTGGVIRKWSDERMPISFYIYPGDGVPGFESRFNNMANTAFEDWTAATKGKVVLRGWTIQNKRTSI